MQPICRRPARTCQHLDGCPRPHKAHGWCRAHWERIRKTGKPGPVEIVKRLDSSRPCKVPGCTTPVGRKSARGMCNKHYLRWGVHGDPSVVKVGGASLALEANPNWSGDDASYTAVHLRLRKQRGRASERQCVDCGQQARHWSYGYRGSIERVDPQMGMYSPDLDSYDPRCVRCHSSFDRSMRALITGQRPEETA